MKSDLCVLMMMLFLGVFYNSVNSQSYPRWFLNTREIPCNTSVGYGKASIFPDSAFARAFIQGCVNFARQTEVRVKGGQAFWSTEIGTIWMGSDFEEKFDTTMVAQMKTFLVVLDSVQLQNLVIVLVGTKECTLPDSLKVMLPLSVTPEPEWINHLPNDERGLYAVGMAPEYFYESSSWLEAERNARLNLARELLTKIQSLQKMSTGGEEIRHEETEVVLRNLQVLARWRDLDKKIFYVLIQMPRN